VLCEFFWIYSKRNIVIWKRMTNNYDNKPAWESDYITDGIFRSGSTSHISYIYWNSNRKQMMFSNTLGEKNNVLCYHDGELAYSNMMNWKCKNGKLLDLKSVEYYMY
jgi:hypothetical protein